MSSSEITNAGDQEVTWDVIESRLPGFDLTSVKKLVGGNQNRYLRMLAQFYSEYREESVNFVYELAIDKRSTAEKMLHKLKGVSGNLGARALNQACENLDAQLKKARYSEKEFDEWQDEFNRTIDCIRVLLEKYPACLPGPEQKADSSLDEQFSELEAILADDGYVEESLLNKIHARLSPEETELYGILAKHIAMVDYPKARSALKTLRYMSRAVA